MIHPHAPEKNNPKNIKKTKPKLQHMETHQKCVGKGGEGESLLNTKQSCAK